MKIIYVTGSQAKFDRAQDETRPRGVELEQVKLDLIEIQAESSAEVSTHKAKQAFDQLKRPVVVSDNSWAIPALKGFPGPYMASINHWLEPADWLRLMKGMPDRTIILEEYLTYCDETGTQQFKRTTDGQILEDAQGTAGSALDKVVTISEDGRSIALWHATQTYAPIKGPSPWHKLTDWLASK